MYIYHLLEVKWILPIEAGSRDKEQVSQRHINSFLDVETIHAHYGSNAWVKCEDFDSEDYIAQTTSHIDKGARYQYVDSDDLSDVLLVEKLYIVKKRLLGCAASKELEEVAIAILKRHPVYTDLANDLLQMKGA